MTSCFVLSQDTQIESCTRVSRYSVDNGFLIGFRTVKCLLQYRRDHMVLHVNLKISILLMEREVSIYLIFALLLHCRVRIARKDKVFHIS